jgi:hypothetical protein
VRVRFPSPALIKPAGQSRVDGNRLDHRVAWNGLAYWHAKTSISAG